MADPYTSLSGQRRSITRDSTRRLRELEKLADKGVPKAAMEAEYAEVARLRRTEPTTSRPEGRELERQAQRKIDLTRRAEVDPNIDFERDVAPLRSKWFADVTSANTTLSPREQQMMRDRYRGSLIEEPKMITDRDRKVARENVALQQAQLLLKQGKKDARQQREIERVIPGVVDQINPILASQNTASDKLTALTRLRLSNPMLAADPRVTSLFNSAAASISGKHQDQRYVDNQQFQIALSAARTGSTGAIEKFYPDTSNPLSNSLRALAEAVKQGRISESQADAYTDAIKRMYDKQDFSLKQLDAQGTEVDNIQKEYGRLSGDGLDWDMGEESLPSDSVTADWVKRAQMSRLLDILISVAGTEVVDKLELSDESIQAMESTELDKEFLRLLSITREHIRTKKRIMMDNRYGEGQDSIDKQTLDKMVR